MSTIRLFGRIVVAVCIALSAGLATGASAQAQTLDAVRERGHVICGSVSNLAGFSQRDEAGFWSGFDVDFCRAVAAATLGDPNAVEFRPLNGEARFALLQTGAIDLIARNAAWTLLRDTLYGAHYVSTSFFDGQAFMVPQTLDIVSAYELDDISICMVDDRDELTAIGDFFFDIQTQYREVLYEDREDLAVAYEAGYCDAVAAPATWLYAIRRGLADPTTQRILPERISKQPFGPVVRQGDDEWFNIVKWVLFTLINAEEMGVTSLNLDPLQSAKTPTVRRLLGLESDFGSALRLDQKWMQNVIRAVGNYSELYGRHFGPQTGAALPRGQNALWTKGGLLYAPPIR